MWSFIARIFLISILSDFASANGACPVFQHPFPYKTPFPINVDTKTAKVVHATSPLVTGLGTLNLLRVRNTGKAIESMPNEFVDQSYITGGILCNDTYEFYKTRFYINQNGGTSANEVDGVGSPFEILIIFFKIEYKTFKNALNHPDGLAIISYRITIGPVPNLLFIPVQLVLLLGLLREPGSLVLVISTLLYIWFDDIPLINEYIVYPGSYTDLDTGREFDCAIYILTVPNFNFISKTQFLAFKNVLNSDGFPLQTVAPLTPRGKRPILKVFGDFQQRFLLL